MVDKPDRAAAILEAAEELLAELDDGPSELHEASFELPETAIEIPPTEPLVHGTNPALAPVPARAAPEAMPVPEYPMVVWPSTRLEEPPPQRRPSRLGSLFARIAVWFRWRRARRSQRR